MADQFDEIQIYTGEEQRANEQAMTMVVPQAHGAMSVDSARAVAEVQAAIVAARLDPRSEIQAYNRIMKACQRRTLAESAIYAYKRGSNVISGPTIRLAEVAARAWRNITYGTREVNRRDGASQMQAFAWDLESNTRVIREFEVRHVRDKKDGSGVLSSERDIYELTTNMGQRRVRACIFELIPGDIIEAAMAQCEKTLASGDGKPIEDRIRDMLVRFDEVGVTQAMLEQYLGHKIEATITPELVKLQQIFRSIRDGMAKREEFFTFSEAVQTNPSASEEPATKKRTRAGKATQPEPPPDELPSRDMEHDNPGPTQELSGGVSASIDCKLRSGVKMNPTDCAQSMCQHKDECVATPAG